MVFDERDLDQEESNEDMKKKHKPHNDQMGFEDMLSTKNENKSEKTSSKRETSSKKKPSASKSKKQEKDDEKIVIIDKNLSKVDTSKVLKNEQLSFDDSLDEEDAEEDETLNSKYEEWETGSSNGSGKFEDTFTIDSDGSYTKDIAKVYHDSMIPYSEYVILDRAIPRVEDGLKPVQRRILYSMWELGVTPDKPYKKSAKTVGDVIANYHPHGDSSIYNAMVHMAQKFNMREILIDGHGNFGSVDGDGAAAMRYTEAKLAPLSLELLRDIEKNTVRWAKNYDDSKDEPEMLPSRFPNILVNGSTGIAVGLATNIPPHNLSECIDGCCSYIDNPNISLDELMKHLKGPDFPTGGIILGTDGIRQAYETGKGKILVRAKTHIEQDKGGKQIIVIDEFPYQINKSQTLLKIAELKEKYKDVLSPISDIRDESDRQGIRAVVCLKKDADAEMIRNFLFKYTDLQTTIGVNMVAIADGKPRQMGLLEILRYYINYQRDVVLKRTKYDLEAAEERANILEGLLIAIQNIDEVIHIIKTSKSTVEAKKNLITRFDLNEKQAQAILDMRLARLTNLEVYKIEEELASLKKLIAELKAIVKSEKLQMGIVKKEMLEIKKKFGSKRLTEIVSNAEHLSLDDKLENIKPVKDIVILVNERQCIKKMSDKSFVTSTKVASKTSSLNDTHSIILITKTDKDLLLLTRLGNCYKVDQKDILDARWKDRGSNILELVPTFEDKDKICLILDYKNKLEKFDLLMITNLGNIKIVSSSEFDVKKSSFSYLKLKEDEYIVHIEKYEKNKTMFFVTSGGMGVNVDISDVTPTSRTSGLIKGVSLSQDDFVVGGGLCSENDKFIVMLNNGMAKKVEIKEFGVLPRNRKGLKLFSLKDNENVALAFKDEDTCEIIVFDDKDKPYSASTDDISVELRTSKGKILTKDIKNLKLKKYYKYSWN